MPYRREDEYLKGLPARYQRFPHTDAHQEVWEGRPDITYTPLAEEEFEGAKVPLKTSFRDMIEHDKVILVIAVILGFLILKGLFK